jgi:putative hydrolase of the HAD superfamily
VVSRVGLPADELLLIDDAEQNVRAAIMAGWHAAHWTGRERLAELVARASRPAPKQ